jgi:predicted glycosyltransferase
LGTPGISLFPGKEFLTVDRIMQEKGWQFKSRNADAIYQYVQTCSKRPAQMERSKQVQKEVFKIIDMLIEA